MRLSRRIDADGIQELFDANQSLEPKAVGAQVLAMTVLSILTILTFNMLRPTNKIIYEPKVTYHAANKKPPRISESFCGWIPPLLHNHEKELLSKIGLDAIAFLRFLHLMRWLFTLTALVACGGLIPVNFLYTLSVEPAQYDFLSAMTIRDVHGVRLYAHIGSTYFITLVLMILIYHHWLVMYKLRNQWFRSPEYQHAFYARTLCITNIPHRRQSDEGLRKIFDGMHLPYQVTSVHIGRGVGSLPELIERHNDTVEELEEILVKHLKTDPTGHHRPTVRVGGCCGLGGSRRDALKLYTAKLKHTEAAVQQYRAQIDLRQAENYGFVSMASIPAAHAAAHELKGRHPKGLSFKLAPHPKDIIWKNLGLSKASRRFRKISGFILLLLFCLLSLVPLFPIASLANLNALAASGYITFLKTWAASSSTTFTIVSGILPPAVAAVFSYFLPRLMQWLSKYMGATTMSGLDRVVIARYFAFTVISQLIIFTVIGVIFHSVFEIIAAVQTQGTSLKLILENLDKLPARITRTYVDQSSFWLKWFPMRGFLIVFDLAQLIKLMWLSFKTRLSGLTPREIQELTKPPVFRYAIHYSNFLFMGAVGLIFAPLAPLVSLAAAIVFWLSSWVYKYQLMFVFVTHVESGGRSWNAVVNRILSSAMFMQVLIIFTVGLQSQFQSLQFLSSIPPLPVILVFKRYLNNRFANDYQFFLPQYEELSRAIVHSKDSDLGANKLENRYTHPALQAELFKPMVHAQTMPLLRRIYKDKIRRKDGVLTRGIEKKSHKHEDVDVMEGVAFTPIDENQLQYDPMLYSHDREEVDCDFDSVNSTSSTDRESHLATPQMASGYPTNGGTLHRGFGHDSQPDPPSTPGSPLAHYLNAFHGVPHRRHDTRPAVLSAAPSYQTADNRILSHSHGTNDAKPEPEVHHDQSRTRSSRRHQSARSASRSGRDSRPLQDTHGHSASGHVSGQPSVYRHHGQDP